MAVKKVTSRTRSTTKRSTTKRSTAKRATKSKSAAKAERADRAPTIQPPEIAEPRFEEAATTEPTTVEPTTAEETAAAPAAAKAPALKPTVLRPAMARPAAAKSATDPRPSRFTGDYYLHAAGPQPAEGLVRRPGKWLIFVSRSRVDALWESVRRVVQTGRLGHAAKVSTALPDPLSPDPKKHVICVYTADEDNPTDVRRVRDALRALGITWKIPYKSDRATRAGQYEMTTGGPAAKYYE
jgi:hypothetical protein